MIGFRLAATLAIVNIIGFGQVQQPGGLNQPLAGNGNAAQAPVSIRPDYVLGPNDQILIRVPQSDEINEKPFRVATDGFIDLPLAGRVKADGLTVQALEAEITNRLREFIRQPLVSITVTQFRSEPVFFVGAFRNPGIYPLQGRRTLIEMLTAVGGIQPNASRRIKITRRAEYGPIPFPNVVIDPVKKVSTIEVSMDGLTQEINPAEDIVLLSYDVVSVDRAERIYVSGEVAKVSAIEFGERSYISVAQALTEAGGFTAFATRDKVRVLRPVLGTNRRAEIDIDLKRVFEGKDVDFPLQPNDVVFVPRDTKRAILVPVGTSFLGSLPYLIVTALLR
jgi:polysaccharide export outer membrane protein